MWWLAFSCCCLFSSVENTFNKPALAKSLLHGELNMQQESKTVISCGWLGVGTWWMGMKLGRLFTLCLFKKFWSVVDLQCHVSYRYTALWLSCTYIMCVYVYICMYIYNYICIYIHTHTYIFFLDSFPYRLLQNIDYSSPCYTVGACWLSILYTVVHICLFQTPNVSFL